MNTIKFKRCETTGIIINPNSDESEWGWARMESVTVTRKLGVRFESLRHAFYRGTIKGLESDLQEFGTNGIPGRITVKDFTVDTLTDEAKAQLNLKSDTNPSGLELKDALESKTKRFYHKSMTPEVAQSAPALTVGGKTIYRFSFCDFDCELQDIKIEHDNIEDVERYKKTIGLVAASPAKKTAVL